MKRETKPQPFDMKGNLTTSAIILHITCIKNKKNGKVKLIGNVANSRRGDGLSLNKNSSY